MLKFVQDDDVKRKFVEMCGEDMPMVVKKPSSIREGS
jgi:hypothetical protein